MIKYYEVELKSSKRPKDIYSICIKAEIEPKKEEVEKFLNIDMKNMDYDIIGDINEISLEEAKPFYDMENERNFPVLS